MSLISRIMRVFLVSIVAIILSAPAQAQRWNDLEERHLSQGNRSFS